MATNYVEGGDVIQWTNGTGSDVDSGKVVKVGKVLGVTLQDIASTKTGSVRIKGVFTVPKVAAAVIAQGENLVWDVSAGAFDDNAATPATGDVSGGSAVAFEAGAATTTSIKVLFTGIPGTVA